MRPTTHCKSFRSTKLEEVVLALMHLFLPPSPAKQLWVTQLKDKALTSAIVPACQTTHVPSVHDAFSLYTLMQPQCNRLRKRRAAQHHYSQEVGQETSNDTGSSEVQQMQDCMKQWCHQMNTPELHQAALKDEPDLGATRHVSDAKHPKTCCRLSRITSKDALLAAACLYNVFKLIPSLQSA